MPPTRAAPCRAAVSSGGVNWNVSYDEFINTWTTRIDNYLAGSPLAGYGRVFAEASWNTAPTRAGRTAISCIESTKGRYCAGSCNAWGLSAVGGGWMSFGSWTEAINYHVSYLVQVLRPDAHPLRRRRSTARPRGRIGTTRSQAR